MRGIKLKRYFFSANLFVGISFLSLLCIPLCSVDTTGSKRILSLAVGFVFWIGLVLSQIFFWLCNSERKKFERGLLINTRSLIKAPPGIVSFFKNNVAMLMDVLLFASAIATIVFALMEQKNSWIIMISVSLLFLSFNLHCFWNGKNYRYIETINKNKKEHEKDG